jgi:hypothetical protein
MDDGTGNQLQCGMQSGTYRFGLLK